VITFRRLLGFLRPYRRSVIASLVFASLAMVMTVAIPWLVGRTVDVVTPPDTDRSAILPLALAIVGAGILRLGLTVVRRLIAGKVSVRSSSTYGSASTGTCRGSSSVSSTPNRPDS